MVYYLSNGECLRDIYKNKDECYKSSCHSSTGAGIDCHRTWESVLLGSVPVVTNSSLWPLYRDRAFVVLPDWNTKWNNEAQFLSETEEQLESRPPSARPEALVQYWMHKIDLARERARIGR